MSERGKVIPFPREREDVLRLEPVVDHPDPIPPMLERLAEALRVVGPGRIRIRISVERVKDR